LHVATADSVWAFELGHRAAEIAERLGVPKLRFAPGPLPSGEDVPPPNTAAAPSADDLRRAAEIAASVEDENLRESVQKAVSFGLARRSSDRPV
jgi:sugar phosphate isomerase/epimerase